jgi:acetylornithine deacetylase/succinyl-diaminopimelate desuccinylase-like protein
MIINIRHTEEYTAEDILDLIEKACTAHDAEIVDKEVGPIMHTDPDAPVLQYFRQVVENVTGRLPDLDKEHGTTDGRYFPPETTVLLYQPTDNNIHTAQEYSVIEQREHVYEIFKEFVMTSDL